MRCNSEMLCACVCPVAACLLVSAFAIPSSTLYGDNMGVMTVLCKHTDVDATSFLSRGDVLICKWLYISPGVLQLVSALTARMRSAALVPDDQPQHTTQSAAQVLTLIAAWGTAYISL